VRGVGAEVSTGLGEHSRDAHQHVLVFEDGIQGVRCGRDECLDVH
jgi:hypothetical protein